MKNYVLNRNEVILYKGMVAVLSNWKDEKNVCEYNTELLLTNYNIVLSSEIKKIFTSVLNQKTYCIDDIKIYDESVQIVRKRNLVDIYLLNEELFLKFEKEKHAKEFCDKAIKLRDGNSKFVRSVKKTQKVIKETNDALDIDIVDMAKGTATVACELAVGLGTVKGLGTKTRVVAKIAEVLHGHTKTKEANVLAAASTDNTAQDNDLEQTTCENKQ